MSNKITISQRILFHKKREPKSWFSTGYVMALDDGKNRSIMADKHYKPQVKTASDHRLKEMSKGYVACVSDLKK